MTAELSIDARQLGVGLAGWRDAAWAADYFPPDLPADWRMDYYANEHDCLWLSQAEWGAVGPAMWAEWADAVGEGFRFYLQAADSDPAQHAALEAAFGARLGGLLFPVADTSNPDASSQAAMWPGPGGAPAHWCGASGNRLFLLDITGKDLRAQRAMLEAVAPLIGDGGDGGPRHDLILSGFGVGAEQAAELRLLSELLGLA